jgi:hypothetical protein
LQHLYNEKPLHKSYFTKRIDNTCSETSSHKQTNRQTNKQTNRQTNKQTNKQRNKQINNQAQTPQISFTRTKPEETHSPTPEMLIFKTGKRTFANAVAISIMQEGRASSSRD